MEDLFNAAKEAMARSHSPYSQFPVGAAIRTDKGHIYSGCNIENASYPEGWCAETSAISQMILGGEKHIAEILVIAEKKDGTSPCGGCRQRISEFATKDTLVHLCNASGVIQTLSFDQVLPGGFKLDES